MVLKSWRKKEKIQKKDFLRVSTGTKCSKMVIFKNRFCYMSAKSTRP
jgi:hypothetical protein